MPKKSKRVELSEEVKQAVRYREASEEIPDGDVDMVDRLNNINNIQKNNILVYLSAVEHRLQKHVIF